MGYDVIVAGGGIAGIAAALAARRAGKEKVLLLEMQYTLGGLATCGLITIYLPICDGTGRQVSFGIPEELLRLSILHGAEDLYPKAWLEGGTAEEKRGERFQAQFNPWLFAIDAERLLLKEGVEILYGSILCHVKREGSRVAAVEIANKSGKQTLEAEAFVDATGDADLFAMAGAPMEQFQQGNVLAAWYYSLDKGENKLVMVGACDTPDEYKTEEQRERGKNGSRYTGLGAQELTRMMCTAHDAQYRHFLSLGEPSKDHVMTAIGTIPQVRMTRRIAGAATQDDKEPYRRVSDSVGMVADWRKNGAAYELDYGCLYTPEIGNLYAAGRCISVTDSMWDITRVIPCCAVSGQAAGIAAAMGGSAGIAELKGLQRELERQGVKLHFE